MTATDLNDKTKFRILHEFSFDETKEFLLNNAPRRSRWMIFFQIWTITTLAVSVFFIIFKSEGIIDSLQQILIGLVLCFSLVIILHEGLHGLAFLPLGKRNISFGWIPKKFMFYAMAHRESLSTRQYAYIAMLPFAVINSAMIICAFFFPEFVTVFLTILTVHSLFCSGDFMFTSIFMSMGEVYTYDDKKLRRTYIFVPAKDEITTSDDNEQTEIQDDSI
ncbi:hypothetical protein FUAX_34480 [Fulvitalea axinellae]|uniref:DUF3267 domain-containing protein n=1 Tax=Fulvitalea axinellae TaxID=1182444 RepID=A0AAU9CFT5_9BACT|nr:hypothetical protein FUAX_34480 [Fulvitalea axinellae]